MPLFLWGLLSRSQSRGMPAAGIRLASPALEIRAVLYLPGTGNSDGECMPAFDLGAEPGASFPFSEATSEG